MTNGLKPLFMVFILALCSSMPAFATENGQIMYPFGVNTVLNGILPQSGQTQFYNYMQYYTADRLNNSDGNNLDPNFSLNVFCEAVRIVHAWTPTVGPFSISSGIVVPVVYVDIDLFDMSDNKINLGDITLQPLNISYSNESHTFFAYMGFDFGIATGSYSRNDLANTGTNYYSFQPTWNVTWFPTPEWEASASAVLEFNTKNEDTEYQSGSVANLDFILGYKITDKIQLGIQGFFLSQFTDDELNGTQFLDGNRTKVNGIGPQVRYDFMPGGGLVLKWQHEYAAENRSEGDKIWLQFSMPL